MMLLTAWAIYLAAVIAVVSCLSSALCAAGCRQWQHFCCRAAEPKEYFVEICEAFPTMGNGELNHAQIELMPHPVPWAKKQKKHNPGAERRREHHRRRARQGQAESSKLRNLQGTARRNVDVSSSNLEDNSIPGLNRSLRPLLCKCQRIL